MRYPQQMFLPAWGASPSTHNQDDMPLDYCVFLHALRRANRRIQAPRFQSTPLLRVVPQPVGQIGWPGEVEQGLAQVLELSDGQGRKTLLGCARQRP